MKKIFISALLLSVLPFVGCNKAEVIPAPTNTADLKIHFQGIINGSDVEWTKNVLKYKAVPTSVSTPYYDILTGVNYLNLAYYCKMESDSEVSWISIGLGSLQQDPTLGTRPNADTFKAFMDANSDPLNPPSYSDTAKAGFEVLYKDANGDLYRSNETIPGVVNFTDIVEKQDDNGDYIQFKCEFSCVVQNWGKSKVAPYTADSVYKSATIQNAVMTGYFKR
jgi:hypothetical protein